MDFGLNIVDTAPGYEDGYSEAIVGAALRGRRERTFVIDKVDENGFGERNDSHSTTAQPYPVGPRVRAREFPVGVLRSR
jgi:aryl-alcohol dehydrogenase-like predicted oxidoreductase